MVILRIVGVSLSFIGFLRVLDFQNFKITRYIKICYTLKRISITTIHSFRF